MSSESAAELPGSRLPLSQEVHMTIDTGDVMQTLPADRRVGSLRVIDAELYDGYDSRGDDAVIVTVTLNDPDGETWNRDDVRELETIIWLGLEDVGETRTIIVNFRPEHSDEDG
jgi:hypothetical protein